MLAGYLKPHHADIFLGMRLAVSAILGLTAAMVFSNHVFIVLVLALVIGFFAPNFWLTYAINRRRLRLRLSLPDSLDCCEQFSALCPTGYCLPKRTFNWILLSSQ